MTHKEPRLEGIGSYEEQPKLCPRCKDPDYIGIRAEIVCLNCGYTKKPKRIKEVWE